MSKFKIVKKEGEITILKDGEEYNIGEGEELHLTNPFFHHTYHVDAKAIYSFEYNESEETTEENYCPLGDVYCNDYCNVSDYNFESCDGCHALTIEHYWNMKLTKNETPSCYLGTGSYCMLTRCMCERYNDIGSVSNCHNYSKCYKHCLRKVDKKQ